MNWRIIVRPAAEEDVQAACRWYESERSGLGKELLDEISLAIFLLRKNPELRPVDYRGFRRALLRRFPYKIFYRIEGDTVIIFRVLHAKRDHQKQL